MAAARGLSILAKYPFLPEAKEHLSRYGITLESFSDPAYRRIIERAKQRILDAVELGDEIGPWNLSDDDFVELASFPLSILMVAAIGDQRLARRYALAEASLAVKLLEGEDPEWRDDIVLRIAREIFGLDVKIEKRIIGGIEYDYSLSLKDYLRGALAFNKPEWKLVNRILDRGRVLVTSHELIRLLKDRIAEHILNLLEKAGRPSNLPEPIEEAIKEIRGKIPSKTIELDLKSIKSGPNTWPPCMRAIADQLLAGQNVSHFANFAFASFLVNIGFEPDEILKFYMNRPDFNERIARYQIEHIAGLRGSRTRYTTPNCDTLRLNGLCLRDEKLCRGIRNPLTYYSRAVRRRMKIDKDKAELGGERDQASGKPNGEPDREGNNPNTQE